jgi:hypothetical protein
MNVELEKIFSPEVLSALDERVRKLVREELSARMPARLAVEEELTARQVAKMKGVKPKTVYEWKDKGLLKSHTTPTGRIRFYQRDVEGVDEPSIKADVMR